MFHQDFVQLPLKIMERLKQEAKKETKEDTEVGEFRIEVDDDSNTSECLMLMRDIEGKRVSLKVALS
jgi:hypothetical protein